jgi:hypothetical protein
MRQIYFCPNCRAPIRYGDRFCGNCGTNLEWVVQQSPPQPLPQWYDCQCPEQQRNRGTTSSGKRSSVNVTTKPISNEVSKLLADFFRQAG